MIDARFIMLPARQPRVDSIRPQVLPFPLRTRQVLPVRWTADDFHAIVRGERRGVGATLARAGLWWMRWPIGLGVAVRNRAFDRGWSKATRVPVPVVCVGNLTLGGTGKTPCVEYVARFYRGLDKQVAILSRGYGVNAGPNDEAMVLEENLPDVPHLQGRDRVALAMTAVEELESEVLVLDDGFQHRRLARDVDIVLVDASRPIDREYLFPRGLLREPVSSLKRAGAIVLTRVDQVEQDSVDRQREWLAKRFPQTMIATAIHAPVELRSMAGPESVTHLRGRTVGAFCGLGNPGAFRRTLDDLGANVTEFRTYPDHHNYVRADVESLREWAAKLPAGAEIATTQKDQVKLQLAELAGRPVWAVRIGLQFRTGEAELQARLVSAIGA